MRSTKAFEARLPLGPMQRDGLPVHEHRLLGHRVDDDGRDRRHERDRVDVGKVGGHDAVAPVALHVGDDLRVAVPELGHGGEGHAVDGAALESGAEGVVVADPERDERGVQRGRLLERGPLTAQDQVVEPAAVGDRGEDVERCRRPGTPRLL